MRLALVTTGLENLGVAMLAATARARGHAVDVVFEPRAFSTDSGTNSALLAAWFEPSPAETARRVLDGDPGLVGFGTYTRTFRWTLQVAREIRRRSPVPIVLGGAHATGDPARSLRDPAVDAVVVGEGEDALLELAEAAGAGGLGRHPIPGVWFRGPGGPEPGPPRMPRQDLDALPFPDKSDFYRVVPAFEREYLVVARRGCPYRCAYCEHSSFHRRHPGAPRVRTRSVGNVLAELREVRRRGASRTVFFEDPVFTLDPAWMADFARRYPAEVGLPFECYSHPLALSRGMVEALAAAGCRTVRLGVQSLDGETLASMDRKGAGLQAVRRAARDLADHGIGLSVDHMLGWPGDTVREHLEAARVYNEIRPHRVIVHWFSYLPGTEALRRAVAQGRVPPDAEERLGTGLQADSFDSPREPGGEDERAAALLDALAVLPRPAVAWLLRSGAWRRLPPGQRVRQAVGAWQVLTANPMIREHFRTILGAALREARAGAPRALRRLAGRGRAGGDQPGGGSAGGTGPAAASPGGPPTRSRS